VVIEPELERLAGLGLGVLGEVGGGGAGGLGAGKRLGGGDLLPQRLGGGGLGFGAGSLARLRLFSSSALL
jgi:hypothetical protein